jgi:hypothetical protein
VGGQDEQPKSCVNFFAPILEPAGDGQADEGVTISDTLEMRVNHDSGFDHDSVYMLITVQSFE